MTTPGSCSMVTMWAYHVQGDDSQLWQDLYDWCEHKGFFVKWRKEGGNKAKPSFIPKLDGTPGAQDEEPITFVKPTYVVVFDFSKRSAKMRFCGPSLRSAINAALREVPYVDWLGADEVSLTETFMYDTSPGTGRTSGLYF